MALLLPELPRGVYKWSFIGNFFDQTGGEGGETTMVGKLGSRFQVETTPKLHGRDGIALVAKLNANRGLKVRLPFRQPGIEIGNPGNPSVNAASEGTTLSLKGLSAGYHLQAGQMVSVVKNGKRYLHQIVDEVFATGGGTATATITPMIRTPLAGGETVEIANPTIEGFLQMSGQTEWVVGYTEAVEVTVTVKEAE